MPYGLPDEQWQPAKEEIRRILISRAGAGQPPITYSELVVQLTSVTLEYFKDPLFHLLGEISEEESAAGRGMLSAMVVTAEDGRPGSGFFALGEDLGFDTSDPEKSWCSQMTEVYEYWSKH